jgi:hypothetical protein
LSSADDPDEFDFRFERKAGRPTMEIVLWHGKPLGAQELFRDTGEGVREDEELIRRVGPRKDLEETIGSIAYLPSYYDFGEGAFDIMAKTGRRIACDHESHSKDEPATLKCEWFYYWQKQVRRWRSFVEETKKVE